MMEKTLLKICNNNSKEDIDDYNYMKYYSNNLKDVYKKDNTFIICFKGSILSRINYDSKKGIRELNDLIFRKVFKGHRVILTGINLGGNISCNVSKELKKKCIIFNPYLKYINQNLFNNINNKYCKINITNEYNEFNNDYFKIKSLNINKYEN